MVLHINNNNQYIIVLTKEMSMNKLFVKSNN